MNYQTQTGKTIDEAFTGFHQQNPDVYTFFKRFAFDWLATGATKISSKQIIGRIRWHVEVESRLNKEPGDFKINDAFTSRYARLFIRDYPEFEHHFETRELRTGSGQPDEAVTQPAFAPVVTGTAGSLFDFLPTVTFDQVFNQPKQDA